jgi:signal transduction histidine kinase
VTLDVEGDPRLLEDLVANLVSNGVRYNRPWGSVLVGLGRENGSAVMRVSDTGVGIAPDALPHLFDRFYRVDPARSRAAGGTGLGLAIARWVVDAHGGTIEVESEPGTGSTFVVRVPAAGSAPT